MPVWLSASAVFCLGASFASALLCLIWRSFHPGHHTRRSVCDHCSAPLSVIALIPIVGWLWYLGKCRTCTQSVSAYSWVAEILTASVWTLIWVRNPNLSWQSGVVFAVISMVLIAVIVCDFFWQEIPTTAVAVAWAVAVVGSIWHLVWLPNISLMLVGTFVAAGFFLWQYVLSRGEWVGGGDAWIGALSGAVIGWNQIVLVTAVGYIGAAVYTLLSALCKKQVRLRRVPLGAFLAWATLFFLLAKII